MRLLVVDKAVWRLRAAGNNDINDIAGLSLATFGDRDGGNRQVVEHSVANWRATRAPLVVARDSDGGFLGYAMAKPNRAGEHWRIDGQVAVLTHVTVVPGRRGGGVGSALLDRVVKTLRMLGWTRVVAQIPPELTDWYQRSGWTVRPTGEVLAWVEPWIPVDDLWFPDLPSKAFSPLLFLAHRDDYPNLATLELGAERPLLEVAVPSARDDESTELMLGQAVAAALLQQPSLVSSLPSALVEAIAASPSVPRSTRTALRLRLEFP